MTDLKLPDPMEFGINCTTYGDESGRLYALDKLQAYATAAVLAERERVRAVIDAARHIDSLLIHPDRSVTVLDAFKLRDALAALDGGDDDAR